MESLKIVNDEIDQLKKDIQLLQDRLQERIKARDLLQLNGWYIYRDRAFDDDIFWTVEYQCGVVKHIRCDIKSLRYLAKLPQLTLHADGSYVEMDSDFSKYIWREIQYADSTIQVKGLPSHDMVTALVHRMKADLPPSFSRPMTQQQETDTWFKNNMGF